MKLFISALVVSGLLMSCNSSEKNKSTESSIPEAVTDSSSPQVTKTLKAIDTNEALVATALMAAPKELRSDCTVIGYNMRGEFVTFKEGTNNFMCLVDNPMQDGFNAAFYPKALEPFMARGRALRAEGKTEQEIFDIREAEMASGILKITPGSILNIYYGPNTTYDPETSEVEGAQRRYVVYIPWATSATTGLPESPDSPSDPWIMNPGTHRAHIMLMPKPSSKD
jgi:hypothetical protein